MERQRDYLMKIQIMPKVRGNTEIHPVSDTGFLPATQALEKANEVITKKFGSGETIELCRERRRRRER